MSTSCRAARDVRRSIKYSSLVDDAVNKGRVVSPFASGNFHQSFSAGPGAGSTGVLPPGTSPNGNINAIPGGRLTPNFVPGALSGAGKVGIPDATTGGAGIPGNIPNLGRLPGAGIPGNIPSLGRLPGAGIPGNIPNLGRLPGAGTPGILPGALSGVRIGNPTGLNINRVPAFAGVKLPTPGTTVAPVIPAATFRPIVPAVNNVGAGGAGRLPIATPTTPSINPVPGGGTKTPIIQRLR